MTVAVKRVYEAPASRDGARVLVDRLWPRGLSKANARLDHWFKDLAPSDELRQWFHVHPGEFESFRKKYLKELKRPEAEAALEELYRLAEKKLTLLFAYKDEEHNNAVVLKDLLQGSRKPPSGTGPAAIGVGRVRRAARRPR